MTKNEKSKFKSILDNKLEIYLDFANRKDYPDKPCVRRAVAITQSTVFNLADVLCNCGVISWEECCEYWTKVGFVDEFNENCHFKDCGANLDGVCIYTDKEESDNNAE